MVIIYPAPESYQWIESEGGPLVVLPEEALGAWRGTDGDAPDSDYARACAVDGYAAVIPAGPAEALVLGDEPAATTYLPEHRLFVRWCAAESEAALFAALGPALEYARWEEGLSWRTPGAAVLLDAAAPGAGAGPRERLTLDLAPGRYAVRAAWVEPDPLTWLTLVQLIPEAD
ncbi:Imm21 family immunity protein [Kitasatospora sp. NPDC094015]|uniref:Imm21 family immunity protein n=1 Tax=Kitasatospora sp. NPDC094015 TaxID=3155205 RepID=UPI003317A82A